ncbi:ATP-dependent DNA ligase [Pseudonocardia sp. T1-2H]|uniref:ATP-dependent DNA ligase n=1 Tax=Pseudonocardia sp. T1-2H TaxID=3128899 RepID=UPI003101842D
MEFPLRPMIAVHADRLPEAPHAGWSYEAKFDGFRCLAHRRADRVALQSRQQRPLTRYFPEIVAALEQLDTAVVLDGELVLWREGRLDFAGLQQRIRPTDARARQLSLASPASFVVFDVLALDHRDVRPLPYRARRPLLEDLLGRQLPHGLVLMPATTDPAVARAWLTNHSAAGIEGVVAKRRDQPYRPGGRTWRKIRTRRTTEAVVGGVLGSIARPEALILGRYDTRGRLRVAGRTTPLPQPARAELGHVLTTPASGTHPWPVTIPSSRTGGATPPATSGCGPTCTRGMCPSSTHRPEPDQVAKADQLRRP